MGLLKRPQTIYFKRFGAFERVLGVDREGWPTGRPARPQTHGQTLRRVCFVTFNFSRICLGSGYVTSTFALFYNEFCSFTFGCILEGKVYHF